MKKLKVALIGAGNIANVHLEAYTHCHDVEIAAICDINESRLNETADKFGIKNRYTSVDEMLEKEKGLDAADVCVWNCNHASCAIKALNAGLHTMCEKPMAYNAKQAEQMLDAAKKAGKLLMIGFVMRFEDNTRVAKDFIDNGYTGDIYYTKAQYVRRHGNPGGWFCDKARSGGGPVIDIGVHVIDLARYLMGNPKPVSVYAVTNNVIGKRDNLKTHVGWMPKDAKPEDISDVEDFASALIRYDNGAVTHLEAAYDINGEGISHNVMYGTKGGLDITNGVKLFTDINGFLADVTPKELNNLNDSQEEFTAEVQHFIDCSLGKAECKAKGEDGVEIMKILDAIYESARTGHEVIIK